MADQIKLETIGLGQALFTISQLENDIQSTRSGVSSVINDLDWEVRSKEQIDNILNEVCKDLSAQRESLEGMKTAFQTAITRADDFNSEFVREAAGIITAIIAVISMVYPIGSNGIIQTLTNMKDWLGTANAGNAGDKAIQKDQNNSGVVWNNSGKDLLNDIEKRDRSFMNNADGSPNLTSVGPNSNWAARNATDGKVNCRWLTQNKIKWLTGRTMSMDELNSASKRGGFISNGTQFIVINLSGENKTVGDILNRIDQPAENIVLNWGSKHLMMIDKIENDVVYCSDNFTKDWNIYADTGTLPAKQYKLQEFIRIYQSLAGSLTEAYQITR